MEKLERRRRRSVKGSRGENKGLPNQQQSPNMCLPAVTRGRLIGVTLFNSIHAVIVLVGKLRLREVKRLTRGYAASKWEN